jgi:hypothetical protein
VSAPLLWQEVERRFDPRQPPDPDWWLPRERGGLTRLRSYLDQPGETQHFLLAGCPGTGKSTELLRLARARTAQDFVVLVDLEAHLRTVAHDPDAIDRLAPWELAVLMALALERAARTAFGDRWPGKEMAWIDKAMRVAGFRGTTPWPMLASSVELWSHRTQPGPLSSELAHHGPAPFDVFWDAPVGHDGAVDDRDRWVHDVLEGVNRLIRRIAQLARRRVLVIVDGLDHAAGPDLHPRMVRYGQLMARLGAHIVMAVPYSVWSVAASLDRVRVRMQPMFPPQVHTRTEPPTLGPGVSFLGQLFAQRTRGLAGDTPLLAPAQLSEPAYYSGGLLNQFVAMIREVAALTSASGRLWADDASVALVIEEQRGRLAAGLSTAELNLLADVVEDPFGAQGNNTIAQPLYATGRLLPVAGTPPWHMPHPLLWQALGLDG